MFKMSFETSKKRTSRRKNSSRGFKMNEKISKSVRDLWKWTKLLVNIESFSSRGFKLNGKNSKLFRNVKIKLLAVK